MGELCEKTDALCCEPEQFDITGPFCGKFLRPWLMIWRVRRPPHGLASRNLVLFRRDANTPRRYWLATKIATVRRSAHCPLSTSWQAGMCSDYTVKRSRFVFMQMCAYRYAMPVPTYVPVTRKRQMMRIQPVPSGTLPYEPPVQLYKRSSKSSD